MQMNPSKTRRKQPKIVKTRVATHLWEEFAGKPDDWANDDRRKGGVSRTQAVARNCRNRFSDAKGEAQAAHHREARVPMQEIGTDRPVGAMKAL